MAATINRRVCGEIEGDFVLFLIGIRLNRPWKPTWLPVFTAMPRMLKELSLHPELGMLHYRAHFGIPGSMLVQYWRSFEHLNAYAQSRDNAHLPAWNAFNKAVSSNGDVGIWHETYLVSPGTSESIYVNMPRFGLGAAGDIFDAGGPRSSAKKRLTVLKKT
jgi:hypothetical protein